MVKIGKLQTNIQKGHNMLEFIQSVKSVNLFLGIACELIIILMFVAAVLALLSGLKSLFKDGNYHG